MRAEDVSFLLKRGKLKKEEICPVVYALSIIGQKWKIPILWHLCDEGTLRYGQLKRGVHGITNLMLTQSLKELEEHGLVCRQSFDEKMPHTEYSLSERGRSLVPLLREIDRWGREQMDWDLGLSSVLPTAQ